MAARIKRVSSPAELKQAFAIRTRVFVREQRVPVEIELDRDDAKAIHFLALASNRAVGTARLVLGPGGAKIGRMAVLKTQRGKGVGTKLLARAIAWARKRGASQIYLHAQVSAIGFYEAMGFHAAGRRFYEAGISHQKMLLRNLHDSRPHKATGK